MPSLYQLQVNQRTLEGTERVQLEARFATAVGQLGSDDVATQIAGIYGLESTMRADPYYVPIVDQTLAAYIRGRSACAGASNCAEKITARDQAPDPAMQAAVTVLGHIPQRDWVLDLRGVNFGGLDLSGGNFERANLLNADFTYATVADTRFQGSNLRGAITIFTAKDYELAHFDENTKGP